VIVEKPVHPSTWLRARTEFIKVANGNELEMIENFPFMLSLSKHSEAFQ